MRVYPKLGCWITECCERDEDEELTSLTDLFASWRSWAKQNNEYVGSRLGFYVALSDAGFKRHGPLGNAARGVKFLGLRLLPLGPKDDAPAKTVKAPQARRVVR